ncbi:hypothetical protein BD779DRAFT_1685005 [Infundibulicybe gibba]|nr:hypothetical protein BD779DRAFT_1685005 [Infundibulicybe gibba]
MDQDFTPDRVSGRQLDKPTVSRHQTPQRRPGHATSPARTSEGRTPGPSTVRRQPIKTELLQEELLRAQKTSHARSISREGYDGLETSEEEMEDRELEMSMREKEMLDKYRIRNDNNRSKAVRIAHNLARKALGIIYERDDFVWTEEYVEKISTNSRGHAKLWRKTQKNAASPANHQELSLEHQRRNPRREA